MISSGVRWLIDGVPIALLPDLLPALSQTPVRARLPYNRTYGVTQIRLYMMHCVPGARMHRQAVTLDGDERGSARCPYGRVSAQRSTRTRPRSKLAVKRGELR